MRPSLDEARDFAAQGYHCVPLSCEIYADRTTPIETLRRLRHVSTHNCLLESAEQQKMRGRYTFLGYDPCLGIESANGMTTVTSGGSSFTSSETKPADIIRKVLADHKSPRLPYLPPFTGGLVGYFSYDYLKYAEPNLTLDAHDDEGFADADLMLFEKVIAFDSYRQKIVLMVNISLNADEDVETAYHRGENELAAMKRLVIEGEKAAPVHGRIIGELQPHLDEESYCAMVRRAQALIREGDIFQVVLSNRLSAAFEGSLLDTYRVMRTTNPSPYMFYFSSKDLELAGASPETLVKLENGVLHTFPLAGTRPRGATEAEDRALEADLLADEKELAEHNMLVDLGRNDVGKISEFGSVEVENHLKIERFSHVMHLGSTVRGLIRDDRDAVDAVAAALPAGTLSGAPKFRACQIINDLEDDRRGIYGGAVGYLDLAGNMDTCIAIRLAYAKGGRISVRSGAGIVADSIPENEYRECINKAHAVMDALETAQKGLN